MSGGATMAIVGAGPVGSLMGLFLARRGLDVTIYEQRPDMRRVDIPVGRSINLALANRGIDALEKAGLMGEVKQQLIPMRGRMIHDEAGGVSPTTSGPTRTPEGASGTMSRPSSARGAWVRSIRPPIPS